MSKFILSIPASTPAREVVALAKARGITTSDNNVYRVRRLFGSRPKAAPVVKPAANAPVAAAPAPAKKVAAPKSAAPAKAPVARPSIPSHVAAPASPPRGELPAEDLLRAVAAEIGLGRAVEILMGERARVHAVLRR